MFATSAYTPNYPAADESEAGIALAIASEDFLKIRPARLRYTMIYLIFQKRTINVHFYVFEWQANITLKFGKLRPDYHHDTYKVLLRQQGQIRARV